MVEEIKSIVDDLHSGHKLKLFGFELLRLEKTSRDIIFHLVNLEFNYYYIQQSIYDALVAPVMKLDQFTERPFMEFIPKF